MITPIHSELLNWDIDTIAAFEDAVVSAEDPYSIMSNDCATFVLSMTTILGVEPTEGILTYIVDAVTETMREAVSSGGSLRGRLLQTLKHVGGRAVVEMAVKKNIVRFMATRGKQS